MALMGSKQFGGGHVLFDPTLATFPPPVTLPISIIGWRCLSTVESLYWIRTGDAEIIFGEGCDLTCSFVKEPIGYGANQDFIWKNIEML